MLSQKEVKERQRICMKRLYDERDEAGRCPHCGGERDAGGKTCLACRVKMKGYQETRKVAAKKRMVKKKKKKKR